MTICGAVQCRAVVEEDANILRQFLSLAVVSCREAVLITVRRGELHFLPGYFWLTL